MWSNFVAAAQECKFPIQAHSEMKKVNINETPIILRQAPMGNILSRPLQMIKITTAEQRTLQNFAAVDSKIKRATTVRKRLKEVSKEYQLVTLKQQ